MRQSNRQKGLRAGAGDFAKNQPVDCLAVNYFFLNREEREVAVRQGGLANSQEDRVFG